MKRIRVVLAEDRERRAGPAAAARDQDDIEIVADASNGRVALVVG